MFSLLMNLTSMSLLVWAFFSPSSASTFFIAYIISAEAYLLNAYLNARRTLSVPESQPPYYLTSSEAFVANKYPFTVRYPFAAAEYASGLAGIPLATYIFVPLLLYHSLHIQAAIIFVNFFIVGQLVSRIDPRNLFRQAIATGNPPDFILVESEALQNVLRKIYFDCKQ